MLTAFIVTDRSGIAAFFESLPPPTWPRLPLVDGLRRPRVVRRDPRPASVICAVNGLLTWLGLLILGVPYATLLGFGAGVFSLIPVFGTIASSIPIVLVALATGGLNAAVLALGWISLIHLLEANLLNPLIMGTSAEMHPVLIIFALLAGEHAFGIWGALLAVPTASVILSAFRWFREQVLKEPPSAHEGHGAWMRRLLAKWKGRAGSAAPGGST
jgi:predicted PurR-regulated permease PerM